jgi:hypothetical protein
MQVEIPEIRAFLDSLSTQQREIVVALQDLVRRTIPEVEETVVWGALSYHRPWLGGRVKGAVCQIQIKDGMVQLGFIHGASLFDPQELLQGDRKAKRFIPIESVAQAKRPAIAMLIRAAVEYDPSKTN